jgi:hypothetical protein
MRPPRFDSDSEEDELEIEDAEIKQQLTTDEEFERFSSSTEF